MNKYLFLDIDGVLNNEYTTERSETGFIGLDPSLVKLFKDWYVKEDTIDIILSSTWRTDPTMMQEIRDAGINFVGVTPVLNTLRGDEIELFITKKNSYRYVILDDNRDMLPNQMPHLVNTDPKYGLREEDLVEVTKLFQGGYNGP